MPNLTATAAHGPEPHKERTMIATPEQLAEGIPTERIDQDAAAAVRMAIQKLQAGEDVAKVLIWLYIAGGRNAASYCKEIVSQ